MIQGAQAVKQLRAVATVKRWEFKWRPDSDLQDPGSDSPVTYVEYQAALLRDGEERSKTIVEGDGFWSARIHTAAGAWHVWVDRGEPDLGLEYSSRPGWLHPGLFEWSWKKDAIPLFQPYVGIRDLLYFRSGPAVARIGTDEYLGQPCRIVRWIESQEVLLSGGERRVPYERWDLWIREQDSVLVKAEHSYLDAHARPAGPRAPDIVCELTSFDEHPTFADSDFDPAPLIARFARAAEDTAGASPDDAQDTGDLTPHDGAAEEQ